MQVKDTDRVLADLLVRKPVTASSIPADTESLIKMSDWHGISPLLYHQVIHSGNKDHLPAPFLEHLHAEHQNAIAANLYSQNELENVIRLLQENGVDFMILKGTALAWSLYAHPHHRSRADTDLLFPDESSARKAAGILEQHGYQLQLSVTSPLLMFEICCYKTTGHGFQHFLDLHWKPINHPLFNDLVSFRQLEQQKTFLPINGNPSIPGIADHLFITCIHRTTNLPLKIENRLIWLYDIHLLVNALDENAREMFVRRVLDTRTAAPILDSLRTCQAILGSTMPDEMLDTLESHSSKSFYRPRPGLSRWQYELEIIRLQPDWIARCRLVRSYLFPSSDYMLHKYPGNPAALLPWLYCRRIIEGIRKIFISRN